MLQRSILSTQRITRIQAKTLKSLLRPTAMTVSQNQLMSQNQVFATQSVRSFAYHQNVLDHYNNPRNVGSLDKKSPNVGTGLVGAPACGDVMKLQIQVNEEDGTIEKAVFKTFGCGSAIASSSYASEILHGMKVDEATQIKNTDIAAYLKLPPVKLHCSMLAEDAIQAAIGDYNKKKQTQAKQE